MKININKCSINLIINLLIFHKVMFQSQNKKESILIIPYKKNRYMSNLNLILKDLLIKLNNERKSLSNRCILKIKIRYLSLLIMKIIMNKLIFKKEKIQVLQIHLLIMFLNETVIIIIPKKCKKMQRSC